MNILNISLGSKELGKVFSYLTKIGISPKFGTRPISWYQLHQCNAIKYIKDIIISLSGNGNIKVKKGCLYIQISENHKWKQIGSINNIYDIVDNKTRQ